jgi:hypothetical protein
MNDEQRRDRLVKRLVWAIVIFGLLVAWGSQMQDEKKTQLEESVRSCGAGNKQNDSLITLDDCAALNWPAEPQTPEKDEFGKCSTQGPVRFCLGKTSVDTNNRLNVATVRFKVTSLYGRPIGDDQYRGILVSVPAPNVSSIAQTEAWLAGAKEASAISNMEKQ